MKRSAEKIGQLLNYEKLSNIHLLELPKVEKKDIPDFINCPKYEKAKTKIDQSMERYRNKVERCEDAISESNSNIRSMEAERSREDPGSGFWVDKNDHAAVDRYNDRIEKVRILTSRIQNASLRHNDLVDDLANAEEEAEEKLEELTQESLEAVDEDISMVITRCLSVIDNLAGSADINDLTSAIDICLIELRMYTMFTDLIEDSGVQKDCRESITSVNQTFATLCSNENVQNYIIDLYRRNHDLVQTNAGICQQIAGVLDTVDQGQLDTLTQPINVILAEEFNTNFAYSGVIDPAELDAIVVQINKTIDTLNQSIAKAKEAETAAVDFAKTGVNAHQQAETLKTSMHSNVEALDGPLTKNHIAVQMIEETVIDDFFQKDLRTAATALRKQLVNAIGEENFEEILKDGDDRFSLKKAQDTIDKANVVRLQVALDKVPEHIKKTTDLIAVAESDIIKANEVPKQNADALNVEIGKKYILSCFPVFGCIPAFGILGKVKAFESAFRSTNQIYRDLGNTLLVKNKKMIIATMIIGAILGIGGMAAFFVLNLGKSIVMNAGVPGAILLFYIITILGLTAVGKRLHSFLDTSAGEGSGKSA